MERTVFSRQFRQAAEEACDFARRFVEEPLPDAMRFRVHLNSSYDRGAAPDFALFPDDSSEARTIATKDVDEDAVIELLWRSGLVPQWVDVMVVGETGCATILDVVACGRFTEDEQLLYYVDTGLGAFSAKGPWLPPGYVDGTRFSIHDRHECWSLESLAQAHRNSAKVRSLELHGQVFDDDSLRSLTFPHLDVLALTAVSLRGPGLAGLVGMPQLRFLRATLRETDTLDFALMPTMSSLEAVTICRLPRELSAVGHLAAALPTLRELTVSAIASPRADAVLALPGLEMLSFELPAIPDCIAIPDSLRALHVHAREATDADLARYLATCPEHLEDLDLMNTPVSDAIFDVLERFEHLKYLNIKGTRMTSAALVRFAEAKPGFRCSPKENPTSARNRR